MGFLNTLGQVAGGIGMGMVNDWRQSAMNEANFQRQLRGQKELTDYNMSKQLDLWQKTGPVGMAKQLELAGLNKALMYGGAGAGGQTASISAGNINGGQGAIGGGEFGMASQMALVSAQAEVMKSQARLNNVEADKKEGIDTQTGLQGIEESKARITEILAGVKNKEAQTKLTEALTRVELAEAEIKENTVWESVAEIIYRSQSAGEEVRRQVRENHIGDQIQNSLITEGKQRGLQAIANVALTKAQEKNVNKDTEKKGQEIETMKAQVNKWIKEIEQRWKELGYEGRKVTAQEKQVWIQDAQQKAQRDFMDGMLDNAETNTIINGVGSILGGGWGQKVIEPPKSNPIGFPRN